MIQPDLPNFPQPTPNITSALESFHHTKIAANAYLDVVRAVVATISTTARGRTILVGVPNSDVGRWLGESVVDFFTESEAKRGGSRKASAIEIPTISMGCSPREQEMAIRAAYLGITMASLQHHYRPQYELAFSDPHTLVTPGHRMQTIVSAQTADCYVLVNADRITPDELPIHEVIARIRFFIDLARATGRTHVLIAQTATVALWLRTSDVAAMAHRYWIKPYTRSEDSFAEFEGILAGFDMRIPLEDGFHLVDHAAEIMDAVGGCPSRLKMWVERTLTAALERGVVAWQDFLDHSPTADEIKQAREEFRRVAQATEQPLRARSRQPSSPPVAAPAAPKSKRRPGQRRLGRDPVDGPDTAAA